MSEGGCCLDDRTKGKIEERFENKKTWSDIYKIKDGPFIFLYQWINSSFVKDVDNNVDNKDDADDDGVDEELGKCEMCSTTAEVMYKHQILKTRVVICGGHRDSVDYDKFVLIKKDKYYSVETENEKNERVCLWVKCRKSAVIKFRWPGISYGSDWFHYCVDHAHKELGEIDGILTRVVVPEHLSRYF